MKLLASKLQLEVGYLPSSSVPKGQEARLTFQALIYFQATNLLSFHNPFSLQAQMSQNTARPFLFADVQTTTTSCE